MGRERTSRGHMCSPLPRVGGPTKYSPRARPLRTELFIPGTSPGRQAQPPPSPSPAPEGRPTEGRPGWAPQEAAGSGGPGPRTRRGRGRLPGAPQRGRRGARRCPGIPGPGGDGARRAKARTQRSGGSEGPGLRAPGRAYLLPLAGAPVPVSPAWLLGPRRGRLRAPVARAARPPRTSRPLAPPPPPRLDPAPPWEGRPCAPRRRVPGSPAGGGARSRTTARGRGFSPGQPRARRVRGPAPGAQPPFASPSVRPVCQARPGPATSQVVMTLAPHARVRAHPPAPHAARCPRTPWGSRLRLPNSALGPAGPPPRPPRDLRPHPNLRFLLGWGWGGGRPRAARVLLGKAGNPAELPFPCAAPHPAGPDKAAAPPLTHPEPGRGGEGAARPQGALPIPTPHRHSPTGQSDAARCSSPAVLIATWKELRFEEQRGVRRPLLLVVMVVAGQLGPQGHFPPHQL